jgi:hypothetical protein
MIAVTDFKQSSTRDFFMSQSKELKSNSDALVELTECELNEVRGGIVTGVGAGLGSLASSAFEIMDVGRTSGSSPFSPILRAGLLAATGAGVGFTFGGPPGASLKG